MGDARAESLQEHEKGNSSPDAGRNGVQVQLEKKGYVALRMAADYWKACHEDAVRREAELKSESLQDRLVSREPASRRNRLAGIRSRNR